MTSSSCSLRQCIQGSLQPDMAQVHVKAYDVTPDKAEHMEVAWLPNGEAAFHDICWKAAMDSLRMDNPFTLGPLEKDMLIVAKRTAEYFDSLDKVRAEARRIAHMIRASTYAVAFTGAGISTAAGIGDFRGRTGKWTEREKEKLHGTSRQQQQRESRECAYELRRPTLAHEALRLLLDRGLIKHVLTQNTDGLHRLSGVPRDRLSELHGNLFHERCERCGVRYERPYAARRAGVGAGAAGGGGARACVHCHCDHSTGAMCERKGCDGHLVNCIINFGDSLEQKVLSAAAQHARRSDLVLCLGTSLRVAPACDLVEMGHAPQRIVICNRQPTPLDRLCYTLCPPVPPPLNGEIFTFDHPPLADPPALQPSNISSPNLSSSFNSLAKTVVGSDDSPLSPRQDQLCLPLPPNSPRLPLPPNSPRSLFSTDLPRSPPTPEAGGPQACAGSRVFGDCDVLMAELLALLLTPDERRDWAEGAARRREEYARQRRYPPPMAAVDVGAAGKSQRKGDRKGDGGADEQIEISKF